MSVLQQHLSLAWLQKGNKRFLMVVFLHPVISPAAHWHSRDLLPPDHIQSGPAPQSRQQRHSYLGDRLISCIPRTHYPPQSVGQFVSFVPCFFSFFVLVTLVYPPQTDSLCSSDGVIIQTVTSDSTSSDTLDQTQLVVETPGRGREEQLEATSLLEGAENIVTETQEPMTDGFGNKVEKWMCFYSGGLSGFPDVSE